MKKDERRTISLGIDFGDSGRRSLWNVKFNDQQFQAEINAPIIDQVEAIELSAEQFNSEKSRLAGMHEAKKRFSKPLNDFKPYQLYKFANCRQVRDIKVSAILSKKMCPNCAFSHQTQHIFSNQKSCFDCAHFEPNWKSFFS